MQSTRVVYLTISDHLKRMHLMHKKLTIIYLALVALTGLAVVPIASGAVLTEGGVALAPESLIKATNTGPAVFTGSWSLECSHAELNGKLTGNTGGSIKVEVPAGSAKFTGTGIGSDCTSFYGSTAVTFNSALCIEVPKGTDTGTINGCGGSVTFSLTLTGEVSPCRYSVTKFTGTLTTSVAATVNVPEQTVKKEEGPFLCPVEGKLGMDLDLTTSNGAGLIIS
jgi:hypothetical protein